VFQLAMRIWCDCFSEGDVIPRKFTADGENHSPPLAWDEVPEGTCELALTCLDPDASSVEPWVHWLIYRLPGDLAGLPECLPPLSRLEHPMIACQGRNSWSSGRTIGYRGPAPPLRDDWHHYIFHLYALQTPLSLHPGVDKTTLLQAMSGHVLGEAQLTGIYRRGA
jgi:Raf kinase inhibitor-like YbhB/YbcL family protein